MNTIDIKLHDIFRNDLKLTEDRAKIFAGVVKETIVNEVNQKQTEFKVKLKKTF